MASVQPVLPLARGWLRTPKLTGRAFRFEAGHDSDQYPESDFVKPRTVPGTTMAVGSRLRRPGIFAPHDDVARGHDETEASETNDSEGYTHDPAPDP